MFHSRPTFANAVPVPLSFVTDLCTAVRSLETIAQGIKQGPSLPKVELIKFGGDVLKESGSIKQEISSRAKVELRIWISLVLLERQHNVSTMDVEKK